MSLLLVAAGGPHSVVGAGGIASAEAFGQPAVSYPWALLGAGGIASAEDGGLPTVTCRAAAVGAGAIASGEAFGQPTVTSIGGEAPQAGGGLRRHRRPVRYFGVPAAPVMVFPPDLVEGAGGIASAEAFGQPRVTWRRNVRRRQEEELLAV